MATRFYPLDSTPSVSPSFDSGWDITADAIRYDLSLDSPGSSVYYVNDSAEAIGSPVYVLLYQFISPPLDSISAVLSACQAGFICFESDAKLDGYLYLKFRKCDEDGNNDVLIANQTDDNEFDNSSSLSRVIGPNDLQDYSFNQGDRLIIEVGYWADNVKTTSYYGRIYVHGDSGYSDISADDQSGTLNAWIETGDTFSEATGPTDVDISGIHDDPTVEDSVTVSPPDPLHISKYEEPTVEENVEASLPDALVISVFDSPSLTEDKTVDVFPPDLNIDVYDDVSGDESIQATACWVNDDFTGDDDDPPNEELWTETDVNDVLSIQSNKLNFSYTGSLARVARIESLWGLEADTAFEVRIDWDATAIESSSSGDNTVIELGCNVNDAQSPWYFRVGRRITSGGINRYYVAGGVDGETYYTTTDTSGKLRLARDISGNWKAYVWSNGQWEWNGNTAGHSFTQTSAHVLTDVAIKFEKRANVSSNTLNTNIDNFVLITECPPGICQVSVYDGITVTEDVTASLPDALEVSKYDSVAIEESVSTELPDALEVSPYDSVDAEEYIDLAFELVPFVYDSTTIEEYIDLAQELVISVFDSPSLTEDKTVDVEELEEAYEINVFDSASVTEVITPQQCVRYETVFGEYTPFVAPTGWTERWETGAAEPTILKNDAFIGGQLLKVDHSSVDWHLLSWDTIPARPDIEILTRVRWADVVQYACGLALRASGSSGSEYGYWIFLDDLNNQLKLYKFLNGTGYLIANPAFTCSNGNFYWIRFRAEESSIKVKAWNDGAAEPGTWQIDETDSGITSGGWVGATSGSGDSNYYDFFSVATNGCTALKSGYVFGTDAITTDDVPTVSVEEASEDYNINRFDTVTVDESVVTILPDALIVSVYDSPALSEDRTVNIFEGGYEVDVFDAITVEDSITADVGDHYISVFDSTTITEFVKVSYILEANTFDAVNTDEYTDTVLSDLAVDTYDSTILTEYRSILLANYALSVFDAVNIEEQHLLSLGDFLVSVYDTITIEEYTDLSFDLAISKFETVTVTEQTTVLFGNIQVPVFETVSVGEQVVASLSDLAPSVYDSISVDEYTSTRCQLFIHVNDTVGIAEVVSGYWLVNVSVTDSVGVTEYVDCLIFSVFMYINTFDAASITEHAEIQQNQFPIRIFDEVWLSEYVSVELPVVKGLIVSFAEGEALETELRGLGLITEHEGLVLDMEIRGQ